MQRNSPEKLFQPALYRKDFVQPLTVGMYPVRTARLDQGRESALMEMKPAIGGPIAVKQEVSR